VRRLIRHEERFDPAATTRAFSIVCPDLLAAFLPDLLGRLASEAPRASLSTASPAGLDVASALALGAADVALGPARDEGVGLVQRVLGRVRWCVLARRGHPSVRRGRLDRAAWTRHPHVVVGTGGPGPGRIGEALAAAGLERRVGFVAPGFLAAPFAVARTDFFFAAPRELVGSLARTLDLQVLEPPIALPPVPVAMLWHERMQAEPGHQWLREVLAGVVRDAIAAGSRRG
jgi:DNA-binding transcriptional LysR family regulator